MSKDTKTKPKSKTKEKKRKYVMTPSQFYTPSPLRHPGGRPSGYDPKYCQELIEFFDRPPYLEMMTPFGPKKVAVDFPTLYGFAWKIGTSYDTIKEWARVHPEFSTAVNEAKAIGAQILMTNTMHELYNGRFATLVATNYTNLRQKDLPPPSRVAVFNVFNVPKSYVPAVGQSLLPNAPIIDATIDNDGASDTDDEDGEDDNTNSGEFGAIDY